MLLTLCLAGVSSVLRGASPYGSCGWGGPTVKCRCSTKSQTQLHQAIAKVEKWNGTTLGELMRGMRNQPHWPAGLVDELLKAVDIRNYLAHHFLREYSVATPSLANREKAVQKLTNLSVWVDDLGEELDAHIRSLGIADTAHLGGEMQAQIDESRPSEWLFPASSDD
jgi:hypothetical protein